MFSIKMFISHRHSFYLNLFICLSISTSLLQVVSSLSLSLALTLSLSHTLCLIFFVGLSVDTVHVWRLRFTASDWIQKEKETSMWLVWNQLRRKHNSCNFGAKQSNLNWLLKWELTDLSLCQIELAIIQLKIVHNNSILSC